MILNKNSYNFARIIKPLAIVACAVVTSVALAVSQYEPIGIATFQSSESTMTCGVSLNGGPATIHITSVPPGVVNYTASVNNAQSVVNVPTLATYSGNLTLQLQVVGGTSAVLTTTSVNLIFDENPLP